MNTYFKTILAVVLTVAFFTYINGCSTAEQTTGKLAFQQGNFEKAEKEFEKEVKQNPNNEEAWVYLAMSRIQLNKLQESEDAMKQYRKIGKYSFTNELTDLWGLKYDRGFKYYQSALKDTNNISAQKLLNGAINEFQACIIILPDSITVNKNIGIIYAKIGLPEEAIKYYTRILEKTNDTGTAIQFTKSINDIGSELIKQEKYEEAVKEYNKVIALSFLKADPVYQTTLYNIGLAYSKWGGKMQLEKPDDPAYKDKYQSALPYLEELITSKNKANQLAGYEVLVVVYGNLNMQEKALDAIKKRDELKKEENK